MSVNTTRAGSTALIAAGAAILPQFCSPGTANAQTRPPAPTILGVSYSQADHRLFNVNWDTVSWSDNQGYPEDYNELMYVYIRADATSSPWASLSPAWTYAWGAATGFEDYSDLYTANDTYYHFYIQGYDGNTGDFDQPWGDPSDVYDLYVPNP